MTFWPVQINQSKVWIQDHVPETGRAFIYRLERCKNKPSSHACGETLLAANSRLVPSYLNATGTKCGLMNGEVIVRWNYKTITPLKPLPN